MMTEEECLAEIAAGGDAQEILLRAMPSARRRFNAIDRSLVLLLADVRKHFPNAIYYTASGGFNLMLGNSHNATAQRSQEQLVALGGFAQICDGDF